MFDYEFYVDVDRDGLFNNGLGNITDYVVSANWSQGLGDAWQDVATAGYMTLLLNNRSGDFGLTDSNAKYYGYLNPGTLVRVKITNNGTTTQMAVLKIRYMRYYPDPTMLENPTEHQVEIVCEDILNEFLKNEFLPELQESVRVDQALTEVFDKSEFIYPYDGAWFYIGTSEIGGPDEIYDYTQENLIDFEEAYTTLNYTGDNLDRGTGARVQSYIRDLMKAEFAGIFYWDIRNEQFKFLHRHHNRVAQKSPFIARTSSFTVEMDDIVRFKSAYGEGLVNDITVNYYPRSVGAAASVVAESSAVPFALAAQSERTIRMRFRDPDNPNASVGARDVIPSQLGVDIIANSKADGTGEDWTRFVVIRNEVNSAEQTETMLFVRKVGDPVYITTMQRRGTPVVSYQRESVNVIDGESRRLYDKHTMSPQTARAIDDNELALTYANHLLSMRKTPDLFFKEITLVAKEADVSEQIQNRTIGDVITVRDSHGASTEYMIVGERHDAQIDRGLHLVTWVLRPIKYGTPFIIGTSEIGGPDILLV